MEADAEELVIGGASSSTKASQDKDIVSPRTIDGFWVQRQIAEIYPDPVTVADKASQVLTILGSESSARDAENQLMELFEYQSFHVIAKFIKNRDAIVWCTKLMRSDAEERVNIEVAMREKGVGWILRELAGDGQAKVDQPKTRSALLAFTILARCILPLAINRFAGGGCDFLMGRNDVKCTISEGVYFMLPLTEHRPRDRTPSPGAQPEPERRSLLLTTTGNYGTTFGRVGIASSSLLASRTASSSLPVLLASSKSLPRIHGNHSPLLLPSVLPKGVHPLQLALAVNGPLAQSEATNHFSLSNSDSDSLKGTQSDIFTLSV
ncbi:hypothetical protein NMY22_g16541 [Coprinellus aureogranulatus]|nr:hypothetical protein NMY22_g16541 [Coprinellus aureogranulatus]